jgi:hypothetical protein
LLIVRPQEMGGYISNRRGSFLVDESQRRADGVDDVREGKCRNPPSFGPSAPTTILFLAPNSRVTKAIRNRQEKLEEIREEGPLDNRMVRTPFHHVSS